MQQRPIGIIELYQHNEVLIHYCDLLLFGKQRLYVFCSTLIYDDLPERLKKSSIIWFLDDKDKNIDKFIKKNEAPIKECRFLLITTVFTDFSSFIKVASWKKSALIIHSAHTWLRPFRHIHLRKGHQIADTFRLFKSLFMRQAFLRKKLLKKVDYIALPNDAILKYVRENFTAPKNAEFVSIPFACFEGRKAVLAKAHTTFTITGSLGDDVRDYRAVLEALKILLPALNRKIKLILLGVAKRKSGQLLKEEFDQLKHPFLEVITFSAYISQMDYENYLFETDYLILPLKKYTQFYVFRELTCFSKLSGSVNDMVRFGIPAIASEHCTVDELVDKSIFYYENPKELAGLMLELALKEKRHNTKEELKAVYARHLKETIYQKIMAIIDN
ncbi:MAG: hypothetical protein ACI8X3_002922 [Saprospiraceae bacterium]|jgi:hypothetical protein